MNLVTSNAVPSGSDSPTPAFDRFLSLSEVESMTGLRKSTLYRLMREGKFVRSVQIGTRCTRWRASKVAAWMARLEAEAAGTVAPSREG